MIGVVKTGVCRQIYNMTSHRVLGLKNDFTVKLRQYHNFRLTESYTNLHFLANSYWKLLSLRSTDHTKDDKKSRCSGPTDAVQKVATSNSAILPVPTPLVVLNSTNSKNPDPCREPSAIRASNVQSTRNPTLPSELKNILLEALQF